MYNPKLFENKDLLLENLLVINDLEKERYDAYLLKDYAKVRRLLQEIELLQEKSLGLTAIQKQLELQEKVKWKFTELREFIYSKKEEEHAEVFDHFIQKMLEFLHQTKKELATRRAWDDYFAIVAIERYFTKLEH